MISPLVVRDFLARKLRDSGRAKSFPAPLIDRKLNRLDVPPHFHTQPRYLHQKVCFLLGIKHPRYLFLLDMGLGKTWVSLALFRYTVRLWFAGGCEGPKPKLLVLVPGTSNVGQWEDEVRKHCPNLAAQGVDAVGSENRMLQVRGESDAIILTYAGMLALVCSGKIVKDENGNPKLGPDGEPETKGWVLDQKKLTGFKKLFPHIVFDESTAFRNHKSLTFRACRALSWAAETAYALTGTPHGKNPEDLWAQFYVIDKGETLGGTLGLFREALFIKKPDYWRGFTWEFDKRKKTILNRMIRHSSIRYEDRECADLPKRVEIVRPVVFNDENWKYYDRLAEELKKTKGYDETKNAYMRLRQICGGYISVKNSNGDKLDVRFKNNPKLEALVELIEEIPPNRKIVVFNEYKISGDLICEALRKAKVNHIRLYSGTKAKDKKNIAQKLAAPKTRVLVSSSAGAFGGNWQAANYCIWFERPSDPLLWKQERKRCDRIGQSRTVFLIDLAVKGSVDEKIIKAHAADQDLFAAVVDGKRRGMFDR